MATRKSKKAPKKTSKPKSSKSKVAKAKSAKPSITKAAGSKSGALATLSKIDWERVFHPLQDRLVLIESTPEARTAGGLILVEAEKTATLRGKIVAIGSGKRNKRGKMRPLDVRVGDVVVVQAYAGTRVTVESQEALIVREEEVLGVET